MSTTLIPAQASGMEFLASSHFQIAQDGNATHPSLMSVFKKDYPPWEGSGKPKGSTPPRPADIFQKDDRYFNEKASETRKAYEYRFLKKPELVNDADKLRGTNFKMDRDVRFNSFSTTHNADYPPKEAEQCVRGQTKSNLMQSYIPQGDRDKALEPVSDYKDRYRGHDATQHKPELAGNMHQRGPPTIQGDQRQHGFNTTHNEMYRGVTLPPIKSLPAPVGTNIPQGDPDKEVVLKTIHQASYPQHNLSDLNKYNRNAVMGKLQATNYREQDHRCISYVSTFKDSYRPVEGQPEHFAPGRHRNHSDFPQGDDDVYRNAARSNMTTNRHYHGNPPPTKRPEIESGANKRTQSEVWFGEPAHAGDYYSTTTDSTFKPYAINEAVKKQGDNYNSSIPLDYYGNQIDFTTYRTDFMSPEQGKLIPNPTAIDNLKEAHIKAPSGAERWFSTEHTDQYKPKSAKKPVVDPGKLQRSSVPIGTLNPEQIN